MFKPFPLKAMLVLVGSRALFCSVTVNYIEHDNVEKTIKNPCEILSEHFIQKMLVMVIFKFFFSYCLWCLLHADSDTSLFSSYFC